MTIKKILTLPDPTLRKKSSNVVDVDNNLRQLMDDMLQTMYDAPGIGLAAIQIGVPKRVVVMDLAKNDDQIDNYNNTETDEESNLDDFIQNN